MRKFVIVVLTITAACRDAERPATKNTPAGALVAAQQEQPSVPLGPSPTAQELEQQRLSEAWRQLPSFKPSAAPVLASVWITEVRGGPVLGLTQQHLFYDAIALGVLGIGCLVDSMLYAKNL